MDLPQAMNVVQFAIQQPELYWSLDWKPSPFYEKIIDVFTLYEEKRLTRKRFISAIHKLCNTYNINPRNL